MPSVPQQPNKSTEPVGNPEVERKAHMKALMAKVGLLYEARLKGVTLEGRNPAKQYTWVNIKEDRQAFFQSQGWNLCVDEKIKSPYKKPDNTHRRADVILYEIDMDMWEAIQAYNQLRGLEGIEGHKNAAIAAMHRNGVREFTPA